MASLFGVLKFTLILIEVLFLFNVLIFVHEMGHFLAARWRGLFVEEFALWFGKPLWRKKIRGVWYAINSIPAGGYVKLPQMAPMESMEGASGDLPPEARRPVSALDKIIVAFAGPLFSFLLACVFALLVWKIGRPMAEHESSVTIGQIEKGSPAEKVGLKVGDKIVSIDGIAVDRFAGQGKDAILWRIVRSEGETINFVVLRDGKELTFNPKPDVPKTEFYQRKGTRVVGFAPKVTPLVGKVGKEGAGVDAGLRKGDLITHVNGQVLYGQMGISDYIRDHPGEALTLSVERDGKVIELPFKPRPPLVKGVFLDGPAEKVDLKDGDRVLRVDDKPLLSTSAVVAYVASRGIQPISLLVSRGGKERVVSVTPANNSDMERPMIGTGFEDDDGIVLDLYGRGKTVYPEPLEQIKVSVGAIASTIDAVASSRSGIKLHHMGGPVMMMNMYYRLFKQDDGWKLALWFSVLLNVNLALLNMLPLPVLDGGHITLALIESVRRKPVNLKLVEWIQTACAILLIGFMLYVTFYDVQDVFGGKERNKFHYGPTPAEKK